MNKKAIEMSFVWILSIIAGAIILILAIYIAANIIKTNTVEINTKTARDYANALDSLQTTSEELAMTSIMLPKETRVYTSCNNAGNFGEIRIQFSEKTSLAKEGWSEKGGDVPTKNQYLFTESMIQGKQIYFFISSFKMPFKAADIVIAYTDNYCFVNAPEDVKNSLLSLSSSENSNVTIADSLSDCLENSKTVCFTNANCNINVECKDSECSEGFVSKDEETLYFAESLLFGRIFSSKANYECNMKRIAKRIGYVSEIYADKSKLVVGTCNSGLYSDIIILANLANNLNSPIGLKVIKEKADEIDHKNQELQCELY
ncbi:MAG: hypothetical protein WC533_00360 [Candidatus Pacearchaeota archaeon]